MDVFYQCDPSKNFTCPKTSCYINGGPCTQTRNREYAMDPNKVRLVMPLEPEMLKNVKGTRQVRRELERKRRKQKRDSEE